MKSSIRPLFAGLALLASCANSAYAHGHIAAGQSSGTLVLFDESNEVLPDLNPEVYHLITRTSGTYSGTYSLDAAPRDEYPNDFFSLISLSVDDGYPSPAPLGAQVWLKMTIISAPDDAGFSFWENGAVSPTHTLLAGDTSDSFSFILSEPASFGIPADQQDPYGHIHGRAFTVTTPGDYLIGFQLFDASGLGSGGGPLIASSPVYEFQFTAVPEPGAFLLALLGLGVILVASRRLKRI